jgi:hypothetical protein
MTDDRWGTATRLGVVACKWTAGDSRLRPVVLNSGRLRRARSGPSGQSGAVTEGTAWYVTVPILHWARQSSYFSSVPAAAGSFALRLGYWLLAVRGSERMSSGDHF